MALHRIIFVVLAVMLLSCNNAREEELVAREKQLLLRESELAAKEEDYKALIKMRDSLYMADSIKQANKTHKINIWPDSISGTWNSRMICRETTCTTYVIGDQRTEKWVFSTDTLGLMVQVMDNNKLKRRLKADLTNGNIVLGFPSDSIAANKLKINATLNEFNNKVIKGTQTITAPDGCIARFSVELTPAAKK